MSSVLDYWRTLVQSGSSDAETITLAQPAEELPPAIAAASALGEAVQFFARQDHTHAHGELDGGDLHAEASTTAAGFAPAITGDDGYVLMKSGAAAVWAAVGGDGVTSAVSLTVTATTAYVGFTSTAAIRTATLPSVDDVPDGHQIVIKDQSGAAGLPYEIRVMPAGAELLDGTNTYKAITGAYGSLTVRCQDGKWWSVRASQKGVNARDFGVKGDGTTDDAPALNALILSLASAVSNAGRSIYLPAGTYRVASPIRVQRHIILEGDAGAGWFSPTVIRPDKNVSGIVVENATTSADTGRGDWSIIQNLSVQYATQTTGTWAALTGYVVGDTVKYLTNECQWAVFVCSQAGTSGASEPAWDTLDEFAGPLVNGEGSTVVDGSVVWTVTVVAGIRLRGRANVQNFYITDSPGSGLHIAADSAGTPITNANNWRASYCRIQSNKLNGVYVSGDNVNAGYGEAIDSSGNTCWGILEVSFLGNTYAACHAADNVLGPYATDLQNLNASNVFLGCYSESGQPPARIQRPSLVLGGTHGAGFDADGQATMLLSGVLQSGVAVEHRITGNQYGVTFKAPYADGYAFAFEDPYSSYSMQSKPSGRVTLFTGTYGWRFSHNNSDITPTLDLSGDDSQISTDIGLQTIGPGHIGFPRGFYLPSQIYISTASARPTSESPIQKRGTFYFVTDSVAEQAGYDGGILGWQKVHQGIYAGGSAPDYWTVRFPHFGQANTIDETTATVASPRALNFLNEAGVCFTNDNAAAKVGFKLPAINSGVYGMRSTEFSFYVVGANGLRLTAYDSNRKLRWGNGSMVDYLESTTPGSFIKVKAVFGTNQSSPWEFAVVEATGVWTDGTTTYTGLSPYLATQGPLTNLTTDTPLTVSNVNGVWTNRGLGADVNVTLPAGSTLTAGQTFKFRVAAAFYLRVTAQGSDKIRYGATLSGAAGYIRSNVVGNCIEIEYQGSGEFWVVAEKGSGFTVDS